MNDEKILKEYRGVDEERWGKIIAPKGYQKNSSKWHGSACQNILLDVCPDATYISFPFSGAFSNNLYKCEAAEYIKENGVHLFTSSQLSGTINGGKEKALQDCIDSGCTFFCAAGNNSDEGVFGESKSDKYLAIGFVDKNLKYIGTSSIGKELDYVTIPECYGNWTSYAAPLFCGMCGLVQDFFLCKTGRALKRNELIEFINDNLIDVEKEGFDVKTGHGLFVLPDPININISKYVPEYGGGSEYTGFPEVVEAELTIDSNIIKIRGVEHEFDVVPFIKDGRTYVPVRFLELLGYGVEWVESERRVILRK